MKGYHSRILVTVVVVAAFVSGCEETVTHSYATRADAEADQLFERAWLPDIIPASSKGIITRNDLDLNTSTGEFYFEQADRSEFVGHLKRLPGRDGKHYLGYSYQEWVFLVDRTKEFCRYEFQLRP